MGYQIVWDKKAIEFLRKLNKPDAQRIIKKVNDICNDPKHYLETLANINCYKLRVGDHRVLIDLHENYKIITVLLIGHRKDIYKFMNRKKFISKK